MRSAIGKKVLTLGFDSFKMGTMKKEGTLYRKSAFTTDPNGGNPAGVWIGDTLPSEMEMQRIAAEVGYSETAFIAPLSGKARTVRYYSPEKEVPFCGHATIASGVQLGELEGAGIYLFSTQAGEISVEVKPNGEVWEAALTSVAPAVKPLSHEELLGILGRLGWGVEDIDMSIPPVVAYAGAWHPVLAVKTAERLAALDYDFEGLKGLMLGKDWTTLQLIWRESADLFHARNPFAPGGVVEDPATGAAAAALGGYLRAAKLVDVPATVTIHQGVAMGRPSQLRVEIPESGGIVVAGPAVAIV